MKRLGRPSEEPGTLKSLSAGDACMAECKGRGEVCFSFSQIN